MNNLKFALRSVFSWKRGQLGKIIFLGAGLAAGLMLLTKVWFEYSFEGFYPDVDRVCIVNYAYQGDDDDDMFIIGSTPGGISPFLGRRIPAIESYTRYTPLVWGSAAFFAGEERQKLEAGFIMADEQFYDVMPRPMIQGNAKQILSTPMQAMISSKVAAAINGDPVGKTIELNTYPGKVITIAGIFEEIPENTLFRYDIVVSMESIGNFTWDGRENLSGNERYQSFVKLYPGTDMDDLQRAIMAEVEKTEGYQTLISWGEKMEVSVTPISDVHKTDPETKRMTLVLIILAGAIIFATVFNYLLVILSGTVARGREIAVMKCHGAGLREIAGRVLPETLLQLLVLLVTAGALVVLFRGTAEQVLGTSLSGLITWPSALLLIGIMLIILILSTYVQARVYNNIPVASVFRSYKGTGRKVKLALLFIQVAAAAFLTLLLVTVNRQYNAMVNDDPGYNYDNILIVPLHGIDSERMRSVTSVIETLDMVEMVGRGSQLFFNGASGNNVSLEGTEQDLFNCADLYYGDENFFKVFGLRVLEGEPFSREKSREGDMMGDRNFAERMRVVAGWTDGVVGRNIQVSEHGDATITGIYENIKLGVIGGEDTRPTILFYSEDGHRVLFIKMREMSYEAIDKVTKTLEDLMPERDVMVAVYADTMVKRYEVHQLFRKSITIASIIVLIIVLVGLIGYMRDETARREREIAIRKINGATIPEVLQIMSTDIVKIMVPAMIVGIAVSYYVSGKWMEEFSLKVPLHWWISLFCAIALAVVAIAAVSLTALKVARKNPAESIKTE